MGDDLIAVSVPYLYVLVLKNGLSGFANLHAIAHNVIGSGLIGDPPLQADRSGFVVQHGLQVARGVAPVHLYKESVSIETVVGIG